MYQTCPKCSYERNSVETAPAWQCPACGIAYEKYVALQRQNRAGNVPSRSTQSGGRLNSSRPSSVSKDRFKACGLFALTEDEAPELSVHRSGNWQKTRIEYAGVPILTFRNRKELERGSSYVFTDQRVLHVQLKSGLLGRELRLSVDDVPVPQSAADPEARLKTAASSIFAVAILSSFFGVITLVWDIQLFKSVGMGWGSVFFGALYAVLGYFTQKKSKIALGTAIALFALDSIALLLGNIQMIGALFVRFIILANMVRGWPALVLLSDSEMGKTNRMGTGLSF